MMNLSFKQRIISTKLSSLRTISKKLPVSSKTDLEDLHDWHILYIYFIKYITNHTDMKASVSLLKLLVIYTFDCYPVKTAFFFL